MPNSEPAEIPLIETVVFSPVPTWNCAICVPDNHTALPAVDMLVKVALPLPDASRSPIRPPQPDCAPSAASDCQTDCWSLCENSLGGSGTVRAWYCASVVGTTIGPTLATIAALRWSNSAFICASCGASAKRLPAPCEVCGTISSSVSCASAIGVGGAERAAA